MAYDDGALTFQYGDRFYKIMVNDMIMEDSLLLQHHMYKALYLFHADDQERNREYATLKSKLFDLASKRPDFADLMRQFDLI